MTSEGISISLSHVLLILVLSELSCPFSALYPLGAHDKLYDKALKWLKASCTCITEMSRNEDGDIGFGLSQSDITVVAFKIAEGSTRMMETPC